MEYFLKYSKIKMGENSINKKKSHIDLRTTLLMVSAFLIGVGVGAVCITLVGQNGNIPVFNNTTSTTSSNVDNNTNNNSQDMASMDAVQTTLEDVENTQATVTTVPTTTTVVTTTTTPPNLPTPLSDKYTDMVVEKVTYKEDIAGDKVVYLTFDDGPWSGTPEVLDLLDQYGVKATFFVTAQFFEEEDDLVQAVKQISDRGHAVAVHTYLHEYHDIYSSVDAYLDDYKKMDDIIIKATGKRGTVFRFPGGSNNVYGKSIREDLIREMNSRGLVYYDWNAYDGGCDGYSESSMISSAVEECIAQDKSILLMHDTKAQSFILDTLPSIISQIQGAGYRFDVLDNTVKPIQFATVDDEEEEEEETIVTTLEDDDYYDDDTNDTDDYSTNDDIDNTDDYSTDDDIDNTDDYSTNDDDNYVD